MDRYFLLTGCPLMGDLIFLLQLPKPNSDSNRARVVGRPVGGVVLLPECSIKEGLPTAYLIRFPPPYQAVGPGRGLVKSWSARKMVSTKP